MLFVFRVQQHNRWSGGDQTSDISDGGVVRVLNIVVEECRTLSSRERCPFLVHVEVAETGLSGKDSRLYAAGASSLGATVGEALSMSASETNTPAASFSEQGCAPYQIPSELLASTPSMSQKMFPAEESQELSPTWAPQKEKEGSRANQTKEFVRGGWQDDESTFHSHYPENVFVSNPYDTVRHHEYEELHEQMHYDQGAMPPPQHQGQR